MSERNLAELSLILTDNDGWGFPLINEELEPDHMGPDYLRKRGQTRRSEETPPLADRPHEPLPPPAEPAPTEPDQHTSWRQRFNLTGRNRRQEPA